METAQQLYLPPRPEPLSPLLALIRVMRQGDGDLLSLVPAAAYRVPIGPLGYSRRSIHIVNAPELLRPVMTDPQDIYPKNDLMVAALEPLVGESIFVSSGKAWRRQRRMVDPAFSHMHLSRAFTDMSAAVDDYEAKLDRVAAEGGTLSLDLAMSQLTADIICRTVFSTSLQSETAQEVFDAFARFERSVAQVEILRLIFDKPWSKAPQPRAVLEACRTIRKHLGALLDRHLESEPDRFRDIAASVIAARDNERGGGFSREELIDQLGVFFLAGHETTASALTWSFFILAMAPEVRARLRAEVAATVGDGPITLEDCKRMTFVRAVFRETLRLYPPITFLPRVALESRRMGGRRVRKGAMVMIAPWVLHRHRSYWKDADAFDPDRFMPAREKEIVPGTYIPFGLGPRTCVGAAFAMQEASLILARLVRRYDFLPEAPEGVRPVARLTTRPKEQILCRVVAQRSG